VVLSNSSTVFGLIINGLEPNFWTTCADNKQVENNKNKEAVLVSKM
jgi:hypothetical protein